MESVINYIEKNKGRFIKELFEILRIPSVSADQGGKENMLNAANWIREHLLSTGADEAAVMPSAGWPVVFAQKVIDKNLPTILVYGHYDVQPADPLEEWKSPAFEPEIRDGKVFARGADDDKGQLFMQLKAFEYMTAENRLPCNVKYIIEGEEEVSSPSLKKFSIDHKELLKADVILISDTTIYSMDIPTLTVGLRGIAYYEISVKGPNRDLHSGLYGGAVNNPANVLADLISGMKDNSGRITIPGFYDAVQPPSEEEKELLNRLPFDEKSMAASIAVAELIGEEGYSNLERLGTRPTLDVNGIWGGYTGEGSKTVLPSGAHAKISMRLVPDQDPKTIGQIFRSYIEANTPKGVTVEIKYLNGGLPYVAPWDSDEIKAAAKAMEKTFGKQPLPVRSGGSIPVIADFEEVLGIKSVLMGFGLESDAIHSPNENYPLENFYKGIETIPWFFKYFSEK